MSPSTESAPPGTARRELPRWWPACAATVACAALIVPIEVPRALSDHTQLELSGAAWAPAISRYLLVSDDVHDGGDKHRPLLYTLADSGKLDAAPIEIDGAGELNDPEAITAGPDGTFFISTSHSLTKKGRQPRSRHRLLRISVGPDRKAVACGELDLTTARGADGQLLWGDERRLDVEGIAYHEGALFIGLKSPLASDGSASIFRLADVLSAVQSGAIAPGAMSAYARPRLCVMRGGREVCEGVADLAALPDGALLIAANSPKNMPTDGGGALWKLKAPGAPAELLKRFDGLKPEGVALTPTGKAAIVVFDTDGKKPLWMRLSLSP